MGFNSSNRTLTHNLSVYSRRFCLVIAIVCIPQVGFAWQDLITALCPPRGVPVDLAMAIIAQESRGMPYALGVTMGRTHRGYYPGHLDAATALLREALNHTPNVGIGLMQITWSVWGPIIRIEPEALLDARTNITLGCTLLGHELSGSGSLVERIGRYHSRTARFRDAYGARIVERLRQIQRARP